MPNRQRINLVSSTLTAQGCAFTTAIRPIRLRAADGLAILRLIPSRTWVEITRYSTL